MRALIAAGALVLGGCAPGPLFVDQIEDGHALLIDEGGGVHRWPASALPADAGEGNWVGAPVDPDTRAQIAALRARLNRGDDGADITLH